MEFERYSATDPEALEAAIRVQHRELATAIKRCDTGAIVEHAGDLAGMLVTARRESEAMTVLAPLLSLAEEQSTIESSAWFWNAYATALQYLGRRDDAADAFSRALHLARALGWERVQAFVLVHWGRCLVEMGHLDQAQTCFQDAHEIRVRLNDPLQSSTARLITALAQLRSQSFP